MKNLIAQIKKLQKMVGNDIYDIVGAEAVSHYKKSFRDEGFTDKNLEKWAEVKRRSNPRDKKVASQRKILTGISKLGGDLGRSLEHKRQGRAVAITSDKPYAKVHNEGGHAGTGKGFTMKKRQFIGKSAELEKKIGKVITQRLNSD